MEPRYYNLVHFTDRKRHLICLPYSVDNLHKMAEFLGIKRSWFHRDHYDIPKKRIDGIEKKCLFMSTRDMVIVIQRSHSTGLDFKGGRRKRSVN